MTITPHTTEPMSRDEHTIDTDSDSVADLTTHVDLIEASMAALTDILTTPSSTAYRCQDFVIELYWLLLRSHR